MENALTLRWLRGFNRRNNMGWIIKHAEPFPSIDPSIEGDDYETLYWSNEDGWGLGNPTIFTDEEKETLNLPMGGVWEMQED